jgi:cytochrome c oxidase subunit 2
MDAGGAERIAIYLAAHSAAAPLASPSIASESFSWWMPPNGSLHGAELDRLLGINLLLILGLFLLAHLLLVLPQLRRKGAQPRRMLAIEMAALAAVTGMFVWMTFSSQILWANSRFTGAAPDAMQAEVVGKQFQWYFRYPGSDATFGRVKPELIDAPGGNPLGIDPADPAGNDDIVSSELVLAAGREVDLRLRAQDVIHGFFIPGMRIKQDAIPGMVLHIHFTPVTEGEYPILCSQLCGLGHERMQARLRVVSRREFVDWLNERETARLAQEGNR